jgi:hypothetical protein
MLRASIAISAVLTVTCNSPVEVFGTGSDYTPAPQAYPVGDVLEYISSAIHNIGSSSNTAQEIHPCVNFRYRNASASGRR